MLSRRRALLTAFSLGLTAAMPAVDLHPGPVSATAGSTRPSSVDPETLAPLVELAMRQAAGARLHGLLAGKAPHAELQELAARAQERETRDVEQIRAWIKSWYGVDLPDPMVVPDAGPISGTAQMMQGAASGTGGQVPAAGAPPVVVSGPTGQSAGGGAPAVAPQGAGTSPAGAPPIVTNQRPAGQPGAAVGVPAPGGASGTGVGPGGGTFVIMGTPVAGGPPVVGPGGTVVAGAPAGAGAFAPAPGSLSPLPPLGGSGASAPATAAAATAGPVVTLIAPRAVGIAFDDVATLPPARLEAAGMSLLIPHLERTIEFARRGADRGPQAEARDRAQAIITAAQTEVDTLARWLADWYGL